MRALPVDVTPYDDPHALALPSRLTIGQLARLTGLGAKTIRYYEDIGLLPRPPRGPNGYRHYGAADVNRLHLLRRIRFLGVPLIVAKPLLAGADDARCADVQHELLALAHQRLLALDEEIAELRQLRVVVEGYQRELDACPPDATNQLFAECQDMSCIALSPERSQGQEENHERVCNV